jgi:hypothetical protein
VGKRADATSVPFPDVGTSRLVQLERFFLAFSGCGYVGVARKRTTVR